MPEKQKLYSAAEIANAFKVPKSRIQNFESTTFQMSEFDKALIRSFENDLHLLMVKSWKEGK